MSRSQSLSAWYRRLSARERRSVAAGALVSVVALLAAWVILPFTRRWHDREATIAAEQTRLGQLRDLVSSETTLKQRVDSLQHARQRLRGRFLTGSTPALAASNLQALLQSYADSSRVSLERVDPVADPGTATANGLPSIPVRLSGQGDIYGVTALLGRLQGGEKLLAVDELSFNVVNGGTVKADLVVFSVRLHGVYSPD
jgi:type II secretory pathway component PulM